MLTGRIERSVPLSVSLKALLGGGLQQFGWIFFGIGMIFVWNFIPNVDYSSLAFHGKIEHVKGTITSIEETAVSVNDSPIILYYYYFKALDGNEYTGYSYSTGLQYPPGEAVDVEYPAGKPEHSRIAGMRWEMFSLWALLFLLLPIIGFPFLYYGLKRGIKTNHLLRNGILTKGKFISKQATNTTVNDQRVYKLTFEYKADDGKIYQIHHKTHETHKLLDEREESLLFDPLDPNGGMLMDAIPGGPKIDARGAIMPISHLKTALSLIAPLFVVVSNSMWLLSLIDS
ncbi:DUF3592 domain-containing protein [candidate division KSB1 bacterium]|nr:DUF3592 domain-containing protein [candidate division KSB1 bacterium]